MSKNECKNAISWVHTACKTTPTGTLCARRLSDQIEQQSYWNLVVVSHSRPTLLLQHVGSPGTGSSPDASTVFATVFATHLDPPPPVRTRAGRTSDPSASLRARAPRRRLAPAAPAAPSLSESVAEASVERSSREERAARVGILRELHVRPGVGGRVIPLCQEGVRLRAQGRGSVRVSACGRGSQGWV